MDKKELRKKVDTLFKENKLTRHDYSIFDGTDVEVCIEDGDWKHDHLCVCRMMENNGFVCIYDERDEEETGGDWYSARYIFRLIE